MFLLPWLCCYESLEATCCSTCPFVETGSYFCKNCFGFGEVLCFCYCMFKNRSSCFSAYSFCCLELLSSIVLLFFFVGKVLSGFSADFVSVSVRARAVVYISHIFVS